MMTLLVAFPRLLAQDGGGSTFWMTLVYIGPMLFFAYYLIIRPQQQQERKRKAMIEALKKNDKVVTTGGLYGTVISVDDKHDRVVLRVDDEKGIKVAFVKSSVARVIEASDKPADPA